MLGYIVEFYGVVVFYERGTPALDRVDLGRKLSQLLLDMSLNIIN